MSNQANWTDTCSRCGSDNLEHGLFHTSGYGFQVPEGHTFINVKGVGAVNVMRVLCLDCGNIELYVKPDIQKARVKKIVNQLQKEFENWPRRDSIPLYRIAEKIEMRRAMLEELLDEVRKAYPHFVMETINGERCFVKR